jgi:hypothetical protein
MIRIIVGVIFVLHGVVHLLYFGQSARYFELQPGMVWPDGAWAFSKLLGDQSTRILAGIALVLAALGFVAGGAGIFLRQAWWRPVVLGVAIFSTIIYLLFWDGIWQNLDNKGWIGILINAAILAVVLVFQWPNLELVNK